MTTVHAKLPATILAAAVLLGGCEALLPLLDTRNRDCTVTVEENAPMFHITAPATASAGVAFDVVPWVYRSAGSYPKGDDVLPATFAATLDAAARTISVTGRISRTHSRPGANCAIPAIAVVPSAATLSIRVTAAAPGTYTVQIPADHFTTMVPQLLGLPGEPPNGYPPAQATRSVVVQ